MKHIDFFVVIAFNSLIFFWLTSSAITRALDQQAEQHASNDLRITEQSKTQEPQEPYTFGDMSHFLELMEEYTTYTQQEPQSISEMQDINSLIQRLLAQQTQINEEYKRIRSFYERGFAPTSIPRATVTQFRHYKSSLDTALKELYKRKNKVKALQVTVREINLSNFNPSSTTTQLFTA